MNSNIQLVIFDMDGVLVDACEWHRVALNEALKQLDEAPELYLGPQTAIEKKNKQGPRRRAGPLRPRERGPRRADLGARRVKRRRRRVEALARRPQGLPRGGPGGFGAPE